MVEDHGRPELHVGAKGAVGAAGGELRHGRLLQCLGHLHAGRAQLVRYPSEDSGAGVLRPVDTVPETHQPVAPVEGVAYPPLRIAVPLHGVEHGQDAGRCSAVERPRERTDGGRQGRRRVGAGARHDTGGQGRSVHPMLGGGHPVGVDRLHVDGVGIAAPADHEPLGDAGCLVHLVLGHDRKADAASRLGDERERHDARPGQVVAYLDLIDVE